MLVIKKYDYHLIIKSFLPYSSFLLYMKTANLTSKSRNFPPKNLLKEGVLISLYIYCYVEPSYIEL